MALNTEPLKPDGTESKVKQGWNTTASGKVFQLSLHSRRRTEGMPHVQREGSGISHEHGTVSLRPMSLLSVCMMEEMRTWSTQLQVWRSTTPTPCSSRLSAQTPSEKRKR